MALFHSFLRLSSIPLYMYAIHLSMGHFSCFHVLAMVNSAAMNTGVHVPLMNLILDFSYTHNNFTVHKFYAVCQTFFCSNKHRSTLFLLMAENIPLCDCAIVYLTLCFWGTLQLFATYNYSNRGLCRHPCVSSISLFLAALGLCCCVQAFSSWGEQGLLFVAVHRLLIVVASLVAEHGL